MIQWLLLAAICSPAIPPGQQTELPIELAQYNNLIYFVTYYYLNPQPDKAPGMLKQYLGSPLFAGKTSGGGHHRETTGYFFARIARDQPKVVRAYQDLFQSASHDQRLFLLEILQGCGNEQTVAFLQSGLEEQQYPREKSQIESALKTGFSKPVDSLTRPIVEGGDLDFLWWDFMATGNEEPVLRIVQTLKDYNSRNRQTFIVARVAEWSLDSFCRQHDRVLAICKKQLPNMEGVIRERVEELVNTLDAEKLIFALPQSHMIKAVIRETTPGISRDSIKAKPKTFYRVGSKSWRIQKPSSPTVNLITIVKEPDIWIVEMPAKQGIHFVGPYPMNYFFPAIHSSDGKTRLRGLQLGTEVSFMQTLKAERKPILHEGKECDLYLLKADTVLAELVCLRDKPIPVQLTVSEGDGILYQQVYDEFQANLKPDPSLFEVPKDATITENSDDNLPPRPNDTSDEPGLSPFIIDRLPKTQ